MQGFLTNLVIFIVIGLGWLMKRTGKLTELGLKELNALLFTLLMPVSFFKAGLGLNADVISWRYAAVMLGAYVVATAAAWFLSGFRKTTNARRAASILTSVRPNSIFIGIPVMGLWLGQAGLDAQLIYIAVCSPFFNIVPLLMAHIALNGKTDGASVRHAFVSTFKNPILLAGISGLLIGGFGGTPYIPEWVMRTLKVIGDCGNGMALIVIGAALRPEKLWHDVREGWLDMLMKLFVHPAVIMLVLLIFPLGSPAVMQVAVVASSIAPAFNCYVLARGFHMDADYTAMLVASQTLLCMVTMLFWMELTVRVFV